MKRSPEWLAKIKARAQERRIPVSARAHELIKEYYKGSRAKKISEISREFGLSLCKIYSYGIENGWHGKLHKDDPWSEEEIEIVRRNAQYSTCYIAEILKKYGYKRSPAAVSAQRYVKKFLRSLNGYNLEQLSVCFGVSSATVKRWCVAGHLQATKRGISSKEHRDRYWITEPDIVKFIRDHIAIIDFPKADKYWLIGLLTDPTVRMSNKKAKPFDINSRRKFMVKEGGVI